jgi:hypothetical protein
VRFPTARRLVPTVPLAVTASGLPRGRWSWPTIFASDPTPVAALSLEMRKDLPSHVLEHVLLLRVRYP